MAEAAYATPTEKRKAPIYDLRGFSIAGARHNPLPATSDQALGSRNITSSIREGALASTLCGTAAGMRTIWVLRGEAPDDPTLAQLAIPDVTIADLTELVAVLEQLS